MGVNTVAKDNPELTARLEGVKTRNPVRIVMDSRGRIPANARVLDIGKERRTIIAATEELSEEKQRYLEDKGAEIIITDKKDGKVHIRQLMEELYKKGIDSMLLEGGGTVAASFIEEGLIDKVAFFIAPVIIGGSTAPTPVMGSGVDFIKDGYKLKYQRVSTFGQDILVEGYVNVPWEE